MRYICMITTESADAGTNETVGFVEADTTPEIGSLVTVTAESEAGSSHQVSGKLSAIINEGELWW